MRVIYRATYLIALAAFLLIYYGCGSTSSTSRYGGSQADDTEEETDISSRRFSSGDLPDDDQVDISTVMEVYEKRETD